MIFAPPAIADRTSQSRETFPQSAWTFETWTSAESIRATHVCIDLSCTFDTSLNLDRCDAYVNNLREGWEMSRCVLEVFANARNREISPWRIVVDLSREPRVRLSQRKKFGIVKYYYESWDLYLCCDAYGLTHIHIEICKIRPCNFHVVYVINRLTSVSIAASS